MLATQATLTTDNENLSCFVNQESYASTMSGRWSLQLLTMFGVGYMYRKSTLERFIEQEKSNKQEEQLQNLWDN